MARKIIDETGNRHGWLTVLGLAAPGRAGCSATFECVCDCGGARLATGAQLRQGAIKDCGCGRRRHRLTHGKSRTPIYQIWSAMLRRCSKTATVDYENYGARGIRVCDRWKRFENFYADMGDKPAGKSLDRIDNNRGYYPENCRWADFKTQKANQRTSRATIQKHVDETLRAIADYPDTVPRPILLSLVRDLRRQLLGGV